MGVKAGRRKQPSSVHSVNNDMKQVSSNPILYMYINADSLMNKRTELDALIEIHKPSVIGIVEVKPKNLRYKI